jgi:hypothetical protein
MNLKGTIYEKQHGKNPRADNLLSKQFLAGEDSSQSHPPTNGSS